MSKLVEELYVPHVVAARQAVKSAPALQRLLDPKIDPRLLERFMIQYCAHGVKMTAPVEGWIRRAGDACIKAGLQEVGEQLVTHAKHEADHDKMFVEDVHNLVRGWNQHYGSPKLDGTALLAEGSYPATDAYVKLHEDTIVGPMPAGQVAIEYEIENLSLVMVGPLLENVGKVCGARVLDCQSFLKEHNELDVGHTALNNVMMERLLGKRPDAAAALGKTGSDALGIYMRFMSECLAGAEASLKAAAA
ncbi:hypothetical protein P2318_21940 [Myxococcaceae bacterium GXIMD 01537]